MSRTKKGGKAVGFEYWSRRPYSCYCPGSKIKKLTHKVERQDGKKIIRKEQKEKDE